MTIKCESRDSFLETIAGLVRMGLMFTANAETFTIHLTGGY